MSADLAPDWPSIGGDGGYRVEIDSFPPLRMDMPMGLPGGGGTSFADAMIMTAARCVNCIDAVVTATPGFKTFLDLGPVGGKNTII
jgi:4-hydroxy-tetrahydrodipicolinate reductase